MLRDARMKPARERNAGASRLRMRDVAVCGLTLITGVLYIESM